MLRERPARAAPTVALSTARARGSPRFRRCGSVRAGSRTSSAWPASGVRCAALAAARSRCRDRGSGGRRAAPRRWCAAACARWRGSPSCSPCGRSGCGGRRRTARPWCARPRGRSRPARRAGGGCPCAPARSGACRPTRCCRGRRRPRRRSWSRCGSQGAGWARSRRGSRRRSASRYPGWSAAGPAAAFFRKPLHGPLSPIFPATHLHLLVPSGCHPATCGAMNSGAESAWRGSTDRMSQQPSAVGSS